MKEKDISYKSMSSIETRFNELVKETVWVSDWPEIFPDKQKAPLVLTMGFFYRRIFQVEYWPRDDFFLYCLSPSVKKVLVSLLDFPPDSIGVVSRYDLFPLCQQKRLPLPSRDLQLIHPGRISPQKNIEFLIFVSFYFQFFLSKNCQLTLMGSFDNEPHWNDLMERPINYRAKILALIDSLPWPGQKPLLLEGLGKEEWLSSFPPEAIFFSASNLISEDFSVSVAQMQEKRNCHFFLPYWGGFKDLKGDNLHYYSEERIASSNAALPLIAEKAKAFVQDYLAQKLFFIPSPAEQSMVFQAKMKINRHFLLERLQYAKERWGEDFQKIPQGDIVGFARSESAQRFFRCYEALFRE